MDVGQLRAYRLDTVATKDLSTLTRPSKELLGVLVAWAMNNMRGIYSLNGPQLRPVVKLRRVLQRRVKCSQELAR